MFPKYHFESVQFYHLIALKVSLKLDAVVSLSCKYG